MGAGQFVVLLISIFLLILIILSSIIEKYEPNFDKIETDNELIILLWYTKINAEGIKERTHKILFDYDKRRNKK